MAEPILQIERRVSRLERAVIELAHLVEQPKIASIVAGSDDEDVSQPQQHHGDKES